MELTNKLGRTLLGAGLALGFAFAAGNQALAQTCVAPPSDLIGWWDADSVDGTTATDITGGDDGTMLNGVGIVSGKVGNAFSFNGSSYQRIQLPFGSGDISTNRFTVDAWAYPTKTTIYSYGQAILEDDDQQYGAGPGMFLGFSGGAGFWWGGDWYPNPFRAVAHINTTSGAISVTATTNPNEWHHYASTYDGAELCLYIDGVQRACTPVSDDLYDNGKDFLIAGNQEITSYGSNVYFQGEIDEVEIFDRALTATEIQAIYNAGSAGKCKIDVVDIDIKPGSDPNSINLCSAGVIPVAILGSATFDVSTITDAEIADDLRLGDASVKMVGRAGDRSLCSIDDVNSDGFDDLVCKFLTVELVETAGPISLSVYGKNDGQDFEGTDTVNIVKDDCPL